MPSESRIRGGINLRGATTSGPGLIALICLRCADPANSLCFFFFFEKGFQEKEQTNKKCYGSSILLFHLLSVWPKKRKEKQRIPDPTFAPFRSIRWGSNGTPNAAYGQSHRRRHVEGFCRREHSIIIVLLTERSPCHHDRHRLYKKQCRF